MNGGSPELASTRETRTRVRFCPYLSHYASGLPLPTILSRIDLDDSHSGTRGTLGKHGRSVSGGDWAGPVKTIRSKSLADPSDYVSPFAIPPLLHSQSLPVFRTHLKEFTEKYIPSFVLNAPDSFMWSMAIYRQGEQVDPNYDPDLTKYFWARNETGKERAFTKAEICSVLRDLNNLAEDDEPNWGIQVKCQRTQSERRDYEEMAAMRYIQGLQIPQEDDDEDSSSADESVADESVADESVEELSGCPSLEPAPVAPREESHDQCKLVHDSPLIQTKVIRNFAEPAYAFPSGRHWSIKTSRGCNELVGKLDSPHSFSPWSNGGSLEAF